MLRINTAVVVTGLSSSAELDACLVCGDPRSDAEPPLVAISCDCDSRRFMHVACAVTRGSSYDDAGNSWRQCPICDGKYGNHSFLQSIAARVWAKYKDADGPPGSGVMLQKLDATLCLADVKADEGHFAEAERLLRQHVLACEQLATAVPRMSGLSSVLSSKSKMVLGNVLREQHKHAEAEALYREVLAHDVEVYGEQHPDTLMGHNNIGMSLSVQGKLAEAEHVYREALVTSMAGTSHAPELAFVTLAIRNNLAMVTEKQGKHAEAEVLRREGLLAANQLYGPGHPKTAKAISGLAGSLLVQKKFAESEGFFRQSYELGQRQSPDTPSTFNDWCNLIFAISCMPGRETEAEAMCREAYGAAFQVFGDDHTATGTIRLALAKILKSLGNFSEAAAHYEGATHLHARVYGPQHSHTQACMRARLSCQRAAEAALPQCPASTPPDADQGQQVPLDGNLDSEGLSQSIASITCMAPAPGDTAGSPSDPPAV